MSFHVVVKFILVHNTYINNMKIQLLACLLHPVYYGNGGKAAGPDGLHIEAFMFGGPRLKVHLSFLFNLFFRHWGLSAGYQPRPQVVDRGTTARYGGQLRYI